MVQNTKDYVKQCMINLGNGKFYRKVSKELTEEFQVKINELVTGMKDQQQIPEQIHKFLVNKKTCKTPRIYFLPKIHKGILPPPGRPIVSSNNCPSEKISTFVDLYLQPLVKTSSSYVKDTGAFVDMIKEIPKDDIISSLDITSLYTS